MNRRTPLRLADLVTPEVLERALHWPVPDDPAAARAVDTAMRKDQDERLHSTLPLLEVYGKCLLQCGTMVEGVNLGSQLELIHKMLISIDQAIDIATRDVH